MTIIITITIAINIIFIIINSPVNECSLGVHQVKLVVQPRPGLSNCCRVAGQEIVSINILINNNNNNNNRNNNKRSNTRNRLT